MANTGFLSVSELSFDGIKNNLKSYLQAQAQFNDYDFEGSNLSALLDVLSYNTYMNSFYLNMIGSEAFLDSSQIKSSVVSHAKELNYLPRSRSAAKAQVVFTINTGADTPSFVTIPKHYTVKATSSSATYYFSTDSELIVYPVGGIYQSDPVYVYEGKIVNEYFTAGTDDRFVLSSENVDTSSIEVTVIKSISDTSNTQFLKAETLYGLNSNSQVYFVQGYKSNQYEVVFGDGIFGKLLDNGNIVKVTYRSTNGVDGNKFSDFESSVNVESGKYTVLTTTNIAAAHGSEREDIDSIKFYAPRHFTTQERAVTKDDYINLVRAKFPEIKTVSAYGGEDANPPQYGKVILTLIPNGNIPLVPDEMKADIIAYLKSKSITTEPIIKDPEYLYIEVSTNVSYNPSLTTKTALQIKTDVINQIKLFDETYFTDFGNDLRKSKLVSFIDAADGSIVSNDTNVRAVYKIAPRKTYREKIDFSFSNALYRPVKYPYAVGETEIVRSSTFSYEKDGVIYNTARLTDDGEGKLRIYYTSPYSSVNMLETNVGTVDYTTGALSFYLKAYDYISTINIYAKTNTPDILVQDTKYLRIDSSLINVNVLPYSQ